METLMGVRFPVGIGTAVRGVRSGCSLRFSDKLAVSSRKNQKKEPCHGDEAFSGRSVGWSASSAVGPLAYHRGGENAEGTGENAGLRTGVSRMSEACHPPTVRCRPCCTHGRASDHQGRPILSRKRGRERKRRHGQERL